MSRIGASLTDFRWKVDAYIKQEKCSFCQVITSLVIFIFKTKQTPQNLIFGLKITSHKDYPYIKTMTQNKTVHLNNKTDSLERSVLNKHALYDG